LPSSVTKAVTDAVTLPPEGTVPTEKVTTPPETLNVPWLAVADLYVRLEGKVSASVTPEALPGPELVTVMLYVTVLPSLAEAGPETVTARSALALVLTIDPLTVALLLAELGSGLLALTEAVSLKAAPLFRLEGAKTTTVKVSELPEAMP